MAQTPQKIIIDSNILIDYLRNLPQAEEFLNSLMEIIKGATNKRKLEINLSFLENFKIVEINEEISNRALKLMEEYNLKEDLTILDAIIAATALDEDKVLATKNVKDFKGIKGLKIYQPYV